MGCVTSTIIGSVGAALTVNCMGEKACQSGTSFNCESGTDLTVYCDFPEACKGDTIFNFGSGRGSVSCSGDPDSCQGATFNFIHDALTTPGVTFACIGAFCPPDTPAAFSNIPGESCTAAGDCSCGMGTRSICTIKYVSI